MLPLWQQCELGLVMFTY